MAGLILACAAAPSYAAGQPHAAQVQSIRVVPGENGPVIEILSTRPLNPKLQTVEDPLRLVIDLPDATLNTLRHKIPFRNEQIKSIRTDQYQSDPAVTRVVVDLAAPVRYTWDAMGNRLRIRIRADEAATAKPPSVPALTAGPQAIAVPVAIGTSGSLIETGNRVAAGSTITAGEETAILRLNRGGEVRVCPGTTVSVSTSPNGQDLLLGMSKGALETHYGLQESVDSVLTPDFRIVLPGPGEFNLAISADAHGNTCVGSLPGSTSSVVIAELLGNGTYEVKPEQQVVFRRGRLDTVEPAVASCGCPPPQEPVLRASVDNAAVIPESKAGQKLQLENSDASGMKSALPSIPDSDPGSVPPDKKPRQMKVLEAPLVFSGRDMAKARATPATAPAPPLAEVASLSLTTRASDSLPAVVVLPPAPNPKAEHRGFFGKVKHFFGFH
jgi:AMIN domain-containing protein